MGWSFLRGRASAPKKMMTGRGMRARSGKT